MGSRFSYLVIVFGYGHQPFGGLVLKEENILQFNIGFFFFLNSDLDFILLVKVLNINHI